MKPSSTDARTTTVAALAVAVVLALVASLTVGAPGRATPLRTVTDVEPEISVTGEGTAEVGKKYKIDVSVEGIPTNRIAGWTVNWGDGTIDRRRGRPGPVGHVYEVAGLSHGVTVSVSDGRRTWTTVEVVVPSFDDPERIARFDADGGDLVADLGSTGGSLVSATAAVVGPDGRLYVAGGASNTIERFDLETDRHVDTFVPAGRGGLDRPRDLAFGPDGNLYVVGSGTAQVLRFDGTTGDFLDVFVDGPGPVATAAATEAASRGLVTPVALGFGPDGQLYVVDRDDDDIERHDGTTGEHLDTFVTFDAGSRPTGVAWGPDGVMFVTLAGAGRVEVVEPVDDGPGSIAGSIAGSFGADDLDVPTAVALGPDGTVWVADYWTDRLVRFDPAGGSPIDGGIELDGSFGPSRFTFTDEHRVTVAGEAAGATNEKLDADAWLDRAASAEDVTELRFEANQGTADGDLDFVAGGRDYDTVLTGGDVIVALDGTTTNAIRMDLVGAATDPVIDDDTEAGVTYQDVYTGIDVLYSSNGPDLEYSLIVDPGADPAIVALDFDGATDLDLRDDGSVRFVAASGDGLVMTAPVAYQEFGGTRIPVDSAFELRSDGTIGFTVGDYDAGLPLIIDPIFKASQSGGSGGGNTITVNRPAGVFSGDVMLASIAQIKDGAVTPPTGWTLIRFDKRESAVRQDLFYKVAGGSEPASYLFALAQGDDAAGAIVAYSGVDPASPIDAHGGQGNSESSSYTAPSITTTVAGATLVGFFAGKEGNPTTPPAGMAERADQTSGAASAEIADETLGGAGATGTRTATSSSSLNVGQLVALTPLAGVVTVNSTDDDSDASAGDGTCDTGSINSEGDPECTLRAAIEEANASGTVGTVHFDIPITEAGHGGGVWTIAPGSALPSLTGLVTIDGSTQTGWSTTPVVELDGTAAGGSTDGFRIAADDVAISAMAINRFGANGIEVAAGAADATIAGNHIGVDASGLVDRGNGSRGIDLGSGSGPTTVGGTIAADRNLISGNANDGIVVFDSNDNVIIGNYVGTDVTGNTPIGNDTDGIAMDSASAGNVIGQPGAGNVLSGNVNDGFENGATGANNVMRANVIGLGADGSTVVANGRHGVVIYNGANNTLIGGSGVGEGNVISGNVQSGVIVDSNGNAATTANVIAGNLIGTDATGSLERGNGTYGVHFFDGATGNTIGGPTAADGNVISGNGSGEAGVFIAGAASTNNVIRHNSIGVDGAGTSAIPNNLHGVWIEAPNTQVLDNLISGNDVHGIYVLNVAATGTQILRNSIGTNAARTAAIPNGHDGVRLEGSSSGTIVGSAGNGNTIAGNADHGVNIDSSNDNTVQGNHIGTNAGGSLDLGNTDGGVYADVYNSSNNVIGGTGAGDGNTVAFNAEGIRLDSGTDNAILGNAIYSNTSLGIDLGDDGVTANDAGDGDGGPNDLLNFPVISSATEAAGTVTVIFDLDVPANPDQYRVEFFTNPSGADPGGFGEGEVVVSTMTTGPGTALSHTFAGASGDVITATATRIDSGAASGFASTSEFSASTMACSDTDGDGLADCEEDANTDADDDPSTNPGPDTDGDTTPNYLDADDDGDGTPTASENGDPNGDGDPRDAIDGDRDGQPDYLDAPTTASDGTVADDQKISETTGGLTATLGVNDHFGRSVAAIGDVNGDGIADLAVGAHWDDDGSSDRGAVYILFLNADGTVGGEQKISDTEGGFGAVLDNSDEFGIGVAGIGDLDGDLVPDIVVGSHQDDDGVGGNYGAVYVLFLNSDGTVKAEQKISDTEGGLSAVFDANDRFGSSVANIGDLDGDGLNDIVVGAKDDDDGGGDKGAVYVLFLNADGTVKAQQKISQGTGGLAATIAGSGGFGIGVAGPGDIDGDGNADIAVGNYWDDDGGTNHGAVHVLFLNSDGTVKAEQKISDTAGGFNAVLDSNDEFGIAVGALGDVDADGVPDIVVGTPKDDDGNSLSGAAYVLFLNTNGTVKAEQKISNLEGGLGSTLSTGDQFGFGVAGIGDLDGDRSIGLAVGVYGDDDGGPADRGAVYVIDLAGLATVSVNSTGDGGDATPGDGLCHTGGTNTQGAPACTLRAAIQEANASATIDTIHFAIPQTESGYVSSPQSFNIKVGTLLPAISTPMTIDGSTQAEFATHNRPVIEIDGVDVSAGEENGLWITGGGTVIRSLAINRFGDDAIDIEFAGGNTLVGNHIGIDVAGTVAKPNAWGINIKTGGNVVGGNTAADRNVVSGNTEEGIYLKSATATANIVRGNHVGTDAAGGAAVPNQSGGVIVFQGASANQIGGPGAGDGNVIAGNTGDGIEIDGEGSDDQSIEGNHIGVNAAGTAALGNTADAIHVSGGADGVQVLDNLITHAGGDGVEVVGVSSGLVVQGNTFGTDLAGTAVWPGKYASVGLSAGVFDALIGGTGPGDGNVISNAGSDPANPNGISVAPDAGSGISILGNTMIANAGLGIDLDLDGVTANDGGDGDGGPNGLLNFPVLGSVFDGAGDDDVAFDLDVPAGDYRIELFTNRTAGADSSGHGEGEAVVHAETVSHGGSGVEPFVFTVSGLVADDVVTATATEDLGGGSYGSTSEFSQVITVDGPFTVNSTDDDADANPGDGDCDTGATNSAGDPECTLRAAIEEANASSFFATIEFAMPATEAGHSGGLWTIAPGSALPQITRAGSVDATTQPGYAGTPVVSLDGLSAAGATGIRIGALADGSRISGLMVVRFDADGVLLGIGADGVNISDNWIGSDGTGSATAGNDDDGIDVNGSNAVIDGNVVNNNQDEGIDVRAPGATIVGNIIGLEADGATGSGNVDVGIALFAGTTTIGGSTPAERNVISMNWEGIEVNTSGNVIQGNHIGTDTTGALDRGNRIGDGVEVQSGSANTIGGIGPGQGNVIAFNQLKGVDVGGGVDNAVIGNSIHSNGGLGIDLDVDGVAANDGGDGDSGPNDLLNHPEIENVQRVAGDLVVDLRLDVPAGDYRIELFGNTTADGSGNGEGETFLGAATVNHAGGGPESFTVTVTSAATILSATATEESSGPVHGSTSEFSPAVPSPDLVIVNATGDAADSAVGDGQCDTGTTNVDGDPACTLRAAIAEANDPATPVDTVWFAMPATEPGHSGGVWTIGPATGLPSITATTTIDGTNQPGWTASTAAIPAGLDGTQMVVVDGAGTVADGLTLAGDDITIRGLVIGGFDGAGVMVTGARAVLQATYIGTGASGSVANPNTGNGITVAGPDAVVGSSGPGDRLLVSGNGGQGIEVLGSAGGVAIFGSIIGLDATATSAVPNGANGIRLNGSTGAAVGAPGAGNVIAGNNLAAAAADGIFVSGGSGHTIKANLIGTNLADAPLGNFNAGVAVSSASGVMIGGPVAGEGNTIANNGGDGVAITGPTAAVSLLGNAMSDNGGLGIDLDDDGPTPNDSGDGDGGPNGLLNSPALADAEASGSLVVVDYGLDVPAGSYRLEFYSNPGGGDPSGFGEGRTLVGTASAVHGGAGPESGSAVVTGTIGAVLSATVTQDLGGGSYGPSSEFSAVIVSGGAILPMVADRSVRRSDLRAGGGLDPGGAEVAGLAGRALALDGATERLEGPALDIASAELTMEALIRLDSLVGAPRVVSKRNAASNPIYELFVDGATGEAVASIGVGGATATVRGGAIATATWHHLSATWDGTELILFVDGAEVDRTSASGGLAVDVTTEVTIGSDSGGAEALDGVVDDVRVSHRATTASAVAVRHGNVTGPSGLVSVGAQQTSSAGAWTVSGVRSRSGGFALQAPETPGPGAAAWAVATGIDEPGVVFESWWWADTDAGVDLSAGTRAGDAPTDQYEAALTSPSGWELRRRVSGAETVDASGAGTPSPGSWVKVEIRTDQLGDSRILIDGTEVTGWTAQGSGLGSGSMGLRVGNLPTGREWSIDDARGRKLVTPEPVAALGPLDRN